MKKLKLSNLYGIIKGEEAKKLYKLYLTEEEYDMLPVGSQRDFLYCKECMKYYYFRELGIGGCKHGK